MEESQFSAGGLFLFLVLALFRMKSTDWPSSFTPELTFLILIHIEAAEKHDGFLTVYTTCCSIWRIYPRASNISDFMQDEQTCMTYSE